MPIDLAGVHIPTTTPFGGSGEVDLDAFAANMRAGITRGVHGFVVGGSTGEAVLLDATERTNLWTTAAEVASDQVLIAGTGAESTRTTIRMCKSAAHAGAHAVLVQPPAFYRGAMTPIALTAHFGAVADASPVPVLVYQVPLKMSTIEFSTEWIAGIAEHPNVVGMKDSRGDLDALSEIIEATPDDFRVLVGSGALLHAALEAGAVGGILGVANLVPDLCVEIFDAHREGRGDVAAALQARVAPLHNGIVGVRGVPGVKAALDALGRVGGAPRSPLQPLDGVGRTAVVHLLEEAGLTSN
ncbi:MAG: dihydrodipicolinate synthase family protein [Gemmatimonadetes bacterium]|nr:dihydrodipicolinate synthase family protein [Gemmatimonadota bacterium]MBT8402437.1 dihydrodipicolinate synthase family protein [Gemmatimonadota bacterium]NNF38774.1 dihydrodipicolinate synthase family protein [Gemmatimonadota bacterium]